MALKKALLVSLLLFLSTASARTSQSNKTSKHNLMPAPASLQFQSGRLPITESFAVFIPGGGYVDERLEAAIVRTFIRVAARTGITLNEAKATSNAALLVACDGPGKRIPAVDEDESYKLEVSSSQAILRAPTVVGALRGLETFLQLFSGDKDGYFIPAVSIEDKPRFPWRGLMIDIGRHWQPMEVIKRNLDGMAAVKLNVLHLHITEDQGFRIESKKFPKLHEMGSDGNFYTQDQMREIIEYARMRGIRVVPEFDMPGHTTSWFVGHPELASKPGPYQIERKWGIFEPVLDPTNEQLYEVLDGFLGEMAALFPDAFLHIGGDEVEAHHWKENPKIQAFMKERGLQDNHALQAYFNQRLSKILTKHSKRMIGWDEIAHPDLPKDIVVQSWRGVANLAANAKKGYAGILSNGYYIDLMYPTSDHYLNDPIPENTSLTVEDQKLILGGEATMWSEWTSPETIDSRIWPRTAAIAERFWSPREVKDVDDMYRRLAILSVQLEDVGLLHKKNPLAMLRRWVGGNFASNEFVMKPLAEFVTLVEPVKGYRRGQMQQATQHTPLTKLVDIALPDIANARLFMTLVDRFLIEGTTLRKAIGITWIETGASVHLGDMLRRWHKISAFTTEFGIDSYSPNVGEALPLLEDLRDSSDIGLDAINFIQQKKLPPAGWRQSSLNRLDAAAKPKAAVELAIIQPIKELVIAAAEQEKRKTLSPEDWKKMVKGMAAPKKK